MPNVPDPILNNIRCVNCKIWLSCGPVRLLPTGESVCGRCRNYRKGPRDQYRHFAFEALACYFKFPCKYWDRYCSETVSFKNSLRHENQCGYASTCTTFFSDPGAVFKSKRHLDLKAAINLEIIPDEVLEYLRCGNCAGYLSCTPILVCRDGTSLCHRCNAQIEQSNPEFIRDPAFEAFADMIIIPCIFRYRGCTQYNKFGEQSWEHEIECSYGKPYPREQRRSQQESQGVKRQESTKHKERGVIKTHSGHIYATITPNAPAFARLSNKQDLDGFQRHRENLTTKWGRANDLPFAEETEYPELSNKRLSNIEETFPNDGNIQIAEQNRLSSLYENMGFGNELIDELKQKQELRKSTQVGYSKNGDKRKGSGSDSDYYKERERNKVEYSVYT